MTWLNPAAWLAIAAVAAPVLIHLLVHRRAERFAFPTLRFIQPTRLAAIRRRVLEDIALLAVRSAIIMAAVAAVAGPLVISAARRASWNARVARAIVVDRRAGTAQLSPETSYRTQRFDVTALPDGIARAVGYLDEAPPARRELVIAGPLPIGSITAADIAAVPPDIGIRFERIGALPASRTVAVSPLLVPGGTLQRTVTLSGKETAVHEDYSAAATPWPIDVVAPPDARPAVAAAVEAVLSQHVPRPASTRPVRLIVLDGAGRSARAVDAAPIRLPWMADAVARIARDADLQSEASRISATAVESRFAATPWQPLVTGADGRPVVSAADSSGTLAIVSAADADALVTPLVLRSIANSVAPAEDPAQAELLPIPDDQLRAWTRPPGAVADPRVDAIDRDDRRWLWGAVLALLVLEAWMRRARPESVTATESEARVA